MHEQWRLEHGLHVVTPDSRPDRNQFQRLYDPSAAALQNRGVLDPVNLTDSSRLPANPTTASSDFFDRAREASKYDPYAAGNSSGLHRMPLDDRTAQMFGRTPTPEIKSQDAARPKYQPAVLPFPKNPMYRDSFR